MRIGMMADVYKPHVSGITTHIALNEAVMTASGHEVFIFTFGEGESEDEQENVIRSPGLPLVDTGFYINIRYSLQAQKLLHTMDVVHVHHPFLSGRLALRYCLPRNIPIVFTNHTRYDLYAQAYLPVLPEGISDTFLKAYLPPFCAACDLVIAPSQGMQEVLARFGVISSVEVVPNGVDLSSFLAPVEPISKGELGFDDRDMLLIYTGRLGPEKNLPMLLRAFAGASKAYENLALLIVGAGPERDNLEDRVRHMGIADRVGFTGLVPYAQLPRYLAVADAFVTASVTEVHPYTVIEAMASGLPVLGILSPGVGDTVEDGVTGLLASQDDLAEFTAKMVRLVTQQECREEMGRQACSAAKNYDIKRTSRLLLDRYQRLVLATEHNDHSIRQRLARALGGFFR